MSDPLSEVINAATDLAWRPTCNLAVKASYRARHESHDRLIDALRRIDEVTTRDGSELDYLLRAIYRVAACSFANRMGVPYYERKEAVRRLRGCLDVWHRSLVA